MIERLDPECVMVLGGDQDDVRRFVESDFRIRSGMCPNGHGLMRDDGSVQCCGECGFFTNQRPEQVSRQ